MKIEVNITKEPTKEPISFEIVDMSKKKYSEVKIYIPKKKGRKSVAPGDKWYVYFYWRDPETGKMNIKCKYYRGINQKKTVAEREEVAKAYQRSYQMLLEQGWNPLKNKIKNQRSSPKKQKHTLKSAIEYALAIKIRNTKESTARDYKFRSQFFLDWADVNFKSGLPLEQFKLEDFYQFMDYLELDYINKASGERLSNTSIDNTRRVISALFTELKNKRLIDTNFVKGIPKLKSEPLKNRPFTHSQLIEIKKYLEEHDPYLIQFISFLLYPILRPIEITRLKVRDLNTEDWILGVETKTEAFSYRKIITKMQPIIGQMELKGYPGSYSLFTNENKPSIWLPKQEKSKVNHFTNRFKKVKKALGYGKEYGLYSFRHTAIGDLYNSKQAEGIPEQQIIYDLMPITRHKSEAGLRNYLRNIKIALPADHSDIYTIDF
ncbi:hypothetical protein SAMN04487907_101274 [Zunongwangia mangrovi]|uniref:Core-binding (CB) domain-containing protein n=1 Tax=Zunongwangia mangrovi TaxID=1334022 RepID=A0A1I1DC81_9FLAO|nr:site-specific integrase [Zunongwangia mangrovi]SFB72575.1 hypothetical protein SAMN04487907_101274 [Zunongwangia mangrovi]